VTIGDKEVRVIALFIALMHAFDASIAYCLGRVA
jgi:hypothetical protein